MEFPVFARRVFFVFIFLAACWLLTVLPGYCSPLEIAGEYSFDLNVPQMQVHMEVIAKMQLPLTRSHFLEGEVSIGAGHLEWRDWRWTYQGQRGDWQLFFNSPHYTSRGQFSLVHANRYNPDGLSLLFCSSQEQLRLLALERVPSRGNKEWDILFATLDLFPSHSSYGAQISGVLESLRSMEEITVWRSNRRGFLVIEGEYDQGPVRLRAAKGALQTWERSWDGVLHQATDHSWQLQAEAETSLFDVGVGYWVVPPGFRPASAGPGAPAMDQQGSQFTVGFDLAQMQLRYQLIQSSPWHAEKTQTQSVVSLAYPMQPGRWYARITDGSLLTFGWRRGITVLEFSSARQQLRGILPLGEDHQIRVTGQLSGRYRIEYRYEGDWSLRLVYKGELSTRRRYVHGEVVFNQEQSSWKVSYGRYDRGQIGTGFDWVPELQIRRFVRF